MSTLDAAVARNCDPRPSRGLTFVFGPMGSGKSASLIRDFERLQSVQLHPFVLIGGSKRRSVVRSRLGQSIAGQPVESFDFTQLASNDVLLIDEAQFLSPPQVGLIAETSRAIAWTLCTGLLLDFRGIPFDGSLALLAASDVSIPCLPLPPCHVCGSAAIGDSLIDGSVSKAQRRYVNACLAHLNRPFCS